MFSKRKQMTITDESLKDNPNLNMFLVKRFYLNISIFMDFQW